MSKYERLATFILVADEKSFAKAGKIIGISNVAIAKQINNLEDELGVPLFIRTTKSILLTEAGKLCYEQAKQISKEMHEMDILFSGLRKEPFGPFKIGVSRYLSENFIIPHLLEFLEKYPKIEITLEHMERLSDLEKEGIDINIGHKYVGGLNDIIRRIGSTRYVLAASPRYLEKFGTPKNPHDLKKHRYLTHRMRIPNDTLKFDQQEVTLKPFLFFNDSSLMKTSALNHLGIIKLHRYTLKDELEKGTLVEILNGFDTSEQTLYLAYKPYRKVEAKIRCFIDFFLPKIQF